MIKTMKESMIFIQTSRRFSVMRVFLSRISSIDWNTPVLLRKAIIWIPSLFGAWSVFLGADANWDLYNYHLYNAFAFLNGKLTIDFAPGGFQNYFNPTLDIPYYVAITYLPPRLVGFLMGLLHGGNFILLLKICRQVLPALPAEDKCRVPLFLALAGCLTGNFLSQLGNTMGDNTTALFCLGAVSVILQIWPRLHAWAAKSMAMLVLAGVLIGIGSGLKLTNAIYAVALCAGLFTVSMAFPARIRVAVIFGVGVLLGLALSAGYWFYTMWHTFGNPLFPQFGHLFPNPLAAIVTAVDTSWIPKEPWRQIMWPFIISADAKNAGQIAIRQIIWAIAYVLLLAQIVMFGLHRLQRSPEEKMDPRARFVVVFVVFGFVLWMKVFSVYRYLVPIELLGPLVMFLLCSRLTSYVTARRASVWMIGLAVLVVTLGGIKTWGHNSWSTRPFYADVPPLSEPSKTTALITEGDPPWSWLAASFPVEVAFAQIAGNFPQGPGFKPHIRSMVENRGGSVYAVFEGYFDSTHDRAARTRAIAEDLGLTRNDARCSALAWVTSRLKVNAEVRPVTEPAQDKACTLEIISKTIRNFEAENRAGQERAIKVLAEYGFTMIPDSCSLHRAGIGDHVQIFQWCAVRLE